MRKVQHKSRLCIQVVLWLPFFVLGCTLRLAVVMLLSKTLLWPSECAADIAGQRVRFIASSIPLQVLYTPPTIAILPTLSLHSCSPSLDFGLHALCHCLYICNIRQPTMFMMSLRNLGAHVLTRNVPSVVQRRRRRRTAGPDEEY